MGKEHPTHCTRTGGTFVRPKGLLILAILLGLALTSCGTFTETQYFRAINRGKNGEILGSNYYRVTLKGRGDLAKKYKMNAGYLNCQTADVLLNGALPDIPAADYDLTDYASVKAQKKSLQDKLKVVGDPDKSTNADPNKMALDAARRAWLGSMSDADFISMGQSETTNPYKFRKLVIYVSAENFKLSDFAAPIDSVIQNTTALAQTLQARREAEKQKKEGEDKAKREYVEQLAGNLIGTSGVITPDAAKSLLNLIHVILGFPAPEKGK
jgi:hypothetical protein